jgi:hypothetical protein
MLETEILGKFESQITQVKDCAKPSVSSFNEEVNKDMKGLRTSCT